MKRKITGFISLFICFSYLAQNINPGACDKNLKVFIENFNTAKYSAIYTLLNRDYQKTITQKEFGDFLKLNLMDIYGKLISITREMNRPQNEYTALFANGKLSLIFTCDASNKIDGMQWQPYKEILIEPPVLTNNDLISDNPKATKRDLQVDSIAKVFLENNVFCGLSIGIYSNNKTNYYNYGEIKKGSHVLPSKKTIYEIGSISKTFTGILLAEAVNEKKVSINDPVKKLLGNDFKNLSYKGKDVELVHLANHTSRIHRIPSDLKNQPDFNEQDPYKNYNESMLLNYLKKIVIDTFPGTKNEYSNLGMTTLAIILEKVYGRSYEQLLHEKIASVYQLPDTKINFTPNYSGTFANGYGGDGKETPHWNLGIFNGAGGILSNTDDLLRYACINLSDTVPALKLSHYSTYNDSKTNVGLGWHITTTRLGNEMIWHNGKTGGFASFCGIIKSKKIAVVVLCNSAANSDQVALGLLKLLQLQN